MAVTQSGNYRKPFSESDIKSAVVDSIGQRNSYVKTWGCGGFLNETNIYSRGKNTENSTGKISPVIAAIHREYKQTWKTLDDELAYALWPGDVDAGNIDGSTGNGAGVDISGNSTLNNTTVNGNGTDGSGVNISGNLTGDANSTITGNASGNGNGVNISGNITDGNIKPEDVSLQSCENLRDSRTTFVVQCFNFQLDPDF